MVLFTKLMVGASVATSLALGCFSVQSPEAASGAVGTLARADNTEAQDVALVRTLPCSSGCDFWTRLPSR